LGYLPMSSSQYRPPGPGEQLRSTEPGGFHTVLEEQLLTRLLSEAQDHSDRVSEASPPSPSLSRHDVAGAVQTDGKLR
uniref:GIT1 protein n=1 Tax=Echinostoma caproni TaxID=27848 RepID=A0A183B9Y9_9TREM